MHTSRDTKQHKKQELHIRTQGRGENIKPQGTYSNINSLTTEKDNNETQEETIREGTLHEKS